MPAWIKYDKGHKFEGTRLTYIEDVPVTKGSRKARMSCDCGGEIVTKISSVKHLETKSCGCLKLETCTNLNKKHGKYLTHEYMVWESMKARCYNQNIRSFPDYGGRGIKVCSAWTDTETGFTQFLEDMGCAPEGLTIDRIDVNGGYEPNNCRWADATTQMYNQRKRRDNSSGRTGVQKRVYATGNVVYVADISCKRVAYRLGTYKTFEEAVKAREEAELKYYGYIKE